MKRWIVIITITTASLSTFGCSMCCGPFDFDYPNMGGKHERVDPQYGRVGSIFSDPNAGYMGPSADSNLTEPPEARDSNIDDVDDEFDMERMKKDFEDLESIDPLDGPTEDPSTGPLPDPDDESTSARLWKNKPLRPGQTWR